MPGVLEGVDALTGILWKDDGAVFDERAVKLYPPPGADPGLLVVVQAVPVGRRRGLSATDLDVLVREWRAEAQPFEG